MAARAAFLKGTIAANQHNLFFFNFKIEFSMNLGIKEA